MNKTSNNNLLLIIFCYYFNLLDISYSNLYFLNNEYETIPLFNNKNNINNNNNNNLMIILNNSFLTNNNNNNCELSIYKINNLFNNKFIKKDFTKKQVILVIDYSNCETYEKVFYLI